MILGLPALTFFAFCFWPILWLSIAAYFWIHFKRAEAIEENSKPGGGEEK